jgi:hypothetical protein
MAVNMIEISLDRVQTRYCLRLFAVRKILKLINRLKNLFLIGRGRDR